MSEEMSKNQQEQGAPQRNQRGPLRAPWAHAVNEILKELNVTPDKGLDRSQVSNRRIRYGYNRIRETKGRGAWRILVDQFKSFLVLLLAAATVLAFLFSDWLDGAAILAVLLLNGVIGFVTELRAVQSMEALKRLSRVTAKVRREGKVREVAAADLVPGDIVIVEGGDIVSADLRILQSSKLQTDESTLTGESFPVSKRREPVAEDVPLAERVSMVCKGTVVTRGAGEGVVVATGMWTQLGQITSLVEEAEEITPLERRLDQLGHKLIWATLAMATVVTVLGVLGGKDLLLMVETGIALAVAAVPEGLPIVATIALARGMQRMARRNAIINRLSAVETLGTTNIICTDKTGTLTENRMTVTRLTLASGEIEVGTSSSGESVFLRDGQRLTPLDDGLVREALEVGVLCNNASLADVDQKDGKGIGDPLEVALLVVGVKGGVRCKELLAEFSEVREEAFDPETKMMATFHQGDDGYRVAVKGAPEVVLECCSGIRVADGQERLDETCQQRWQQKNEQMAEKGLRVLALATKTVGSAEAPAYEDLIFLGLVGMADPPRREVSEAIAACRRAGVRVVMMTGDQPVTAREIARAVGLVTDQDMEVVHGRELKKLEELSESERERLRQASIFARVSPRQKLDLIHLHQDKGLVVAMTGDGVNDAPALKKADIGIAMGARGTQVAREAADMVLKDDSLLTIVAAIEEGRVIFCNISKFLLYLLSCNSSELLSVGLATAVNAPLPILPLQILFLNLVTDVFPALALGTGKGKPGVMENSPRTSEQPIFGRGHWFAVGGYGLLITGSVLAALALALQWFRLDTKTAVTISFLTLAFAQLLHVFNMRDPGTSVLRNEIRGNPYVWGALVSCGGLLVAAVHVPFMATVLEVSPPDARGWSLVAVCSLVPLVGGQLFLFLFRR